MKAKKRLLGSMRKLALLTVFAGGAVAGADTYTWTGTSGNWMDPINWGGYQPISAFDTDLEFSSGGYSTTNNFSGQFNLNTLGLTGGAWNIAGGTIGIASYGRIFAFGGNSTISSNLVLGADGLGGPVHVAAGGGDDNSNLTLNGLISGTGSLVFNGRDLYIGGQTANTYSGGTVLESGEMHLLNSGALGIGDMTFYGGTLDLAGHSQTVNNVNFGELPYGYTSGNIVNGSLNVAGNLAAIGASDGSTTQIEFAGNLNLTAGQHLFTLNNAINSTFNPAVVLDNPISGSGGLTFDSNTAQTFYIKLNAQSTYTGPTIIDNAWVILGVDNAVPTTSDVTVNAEGGLFLSYIADEHNQTIGALNGGGFVEVGPQTLTIGNGGHDGTFTGGMEGTELDKIGTGTETILPAFLNVLALGAKDGTLKFGMPTVTGPGLFMEGGNVDLNGSVGTFSGIYLGNGTDDPIGDILDSAGTGKISNSTTITYRGKSTARIDANIAAGDTLIQQSVLGDTPYDIVIGGNLLGVGRLTIQGIVVNDTNQFKVALTGNAGQGDQIDVEGGALILGKPGVTSISSALDIGDFGTLDLAPSTTANGVIAGSHDQSVGYLVGTGKIHLGSATLNLDGPSAPSYFTGAITGAGMLEVSNTSTLSLGGNNNFSRLLENNASVTITSATALAPNTTLQIVNGLVSIQASTSIGDLIFGDGVTPVGGADGQPINPTAPLTLNGKMIIEGTADPAGNDTSAEFFIPGNLVLGARQHEIGYLNHSVFPQNGHHEDIAFGGISGQGGLTILGAFGAIDTYAGPFIAGLYGANTYSGQTDVKSNTVLRLEENLAASKYSDLVVETGGRVEAPGGATEVIGSLSGGGTIDLNGGLLQATYLGESTTFSGDIFGSGDPSNPLGALIVGQHGVGGSLTLQGGTQVLSSMSAVEGSLTISGTNTTLAQGFTVDSGSLLINGGAHVTMGYSGHIFMGVKEPGSSFTVSDAGTVVADFGEMQMRGAGQTASLQVLNGGALSVGTLRLLDDSPSRTIQIQGAGSTLESEQTQIGMGTGTGQTLENDISVYHGGLFESGTTMIAGAGSDRTNLTIDGANSSANIYSLDADGSQNYQGTMALTVINGGSFTVGAMCTAANEGILIMDGSTASFGSFSDARAVSTSLDVSGNSTMTVSGSLVLLNSPTLNVVSSSLSAGSLSLNPNTVVSLSDPTNGVALTLGLGDATSGVSAKFVGADSVGGSIRKVGAGSLELGGSADRFANLIADGGGFIVTGLNGIQPTQVRNISANNTAIMDIENSHFAVSGDLFAAKNASIWYGVGTDISGGTLTGTGTHLVQQLATFTGTTVSHEATLNTMAGIATLNNVIVEGTVNGTVHLAGGQIDAGGKIQVTGQSYVSGTQVNGTLAIAPGSSLELDSQSLVVGQGGLLQIGVEGGNSGYIQGNLYSQTIELNGGTLMNNGGVYGIAVDVNNGGTIRGDGTYGNGYVLNAGGTVHPGNSPGVLNSGSATWNGGANFLFEINDAQGTEGTNWSQTYINGDLTINAGTTPGTKFNVLLNTLDLTSGLSGQAANFDLTHSYDWLFADITADLNGFDSSEFAVNVSGFKNSFGTGRFSILEEDLYGHRDLFVHYSAGAPTPEPTSVLVIGAGIMGLLIRRKKA